MIKNQHWFFLNWLDEKKNTNLVESISRKFLPLLALFEVHHRELDFTIRKYLYNFLLQKEIHLINNILNFINDIQYSFKKMVISYISFGIKLEVN